MSIKGFLEAQEMQEGGPAMFTPFAVDPEGSPRRRIAPTYQPNPPPTIALPPIAPITPTPTPEQLNISPSINYNIDMAAAEANAARQGITITPNMSKEYLFTLAQENKPTDLSRATDKFALGVVAPVVAATLGTVFPPAGMAAAAMAKAGVIGGKGGIISTIFGGGKPTSTTTSTNLGTTQFQTQTAPQATTSAIPQTTTSAIPQTPAQQFASAAGAVKSTTPAPVGSTLLGGGFGSTVTPAAGVNVAPNFTTAAQAGSDKSLFGAAYGQGRGGKGMFSSFAHYAAGMNEGEEAAAVAAGVTSGAFASIAEGAETVDGLVSRGYDQAEVDAIAGGNVTEGNTSLAALTAGEALEDAFGGGDGGGGDGGTPVICTQLFSMGIMSANLYQGEGEHAKNIPNVIRRGYHFWAVPFVRGMRKNQLLFKLGKTLGLSWAQYAAHKANPDKFAPNYLGTVINAIGTPICATLGLFVGETDWETLWIDYEKGSGLCLDQQN